MTFVLCNNLQSPNSSPSAKYTPRLKPQNPNLENAFLQKEAANFTKPFTPCILHQTLGTSPVPCDKLCLPQLWMVNNATTPQLFGAMLYRPLA